jgi:hypothetical protein
MWIVTWLTSRIGKAVAGIGLAISLLFSAFMLGRRDAKKTIKLDDLEDYKETREKIDEVDPSPDADAAFERLRRNGWLR